MLAKYRLLQETEIRTLHYLGTTSQVLERRPQLKILVSLCTKNYNGAQHGIACKLLFTCPENYPSKRPLVTLIEKHNFPANLEHKLMHEVKRTLDEHEGIQMLMPCITRTQVLLNSTVKFND